VARAIGLKVIRAKMLAVALLSTLSLRAVAAHCAAPADEALQIDTATLCIDFGDADAAPGRTALRDWIARSAHIVADYYGHFPAPIVELKLRSVPGNSVGGGRTTNQAGLKIQVSLGRAITAATLDQDWVLVHEMVHLALPELGSAHDWLAEGLATYVEGIARAQAGNRDIADVWAEDQHSMPMGLPRNGEGGMDQTRTWGRTYWGGALFCLQADIALRQQTGNRFGLQTALRAVLRDTGGYANEREIDTVLRLGDAATGTHALEDLYQRTKATPMSTDLDALWKRLGVPADPQTQAFDDHAPLAQIRIAITAKPSERP
jgi:hypothetical protein